MNYELAIMALDGLTRDPLTLRVNEKEVVLEGGSASFRELARLFLLLGGDSVAEGEEFELRPGTHITSDSPLLRLRRAGQGTVQ